MSKPNARPCSTTHTGRLNFLGAENLYTAEFLRLVTDKEVLAVLKVLVSSDTSLRTPAGLFSSISQRFLRQGRP